MKKSKIIKELEDDSNETIESPENFTWATHMRSCNEIYRLYMDEHLDIQPEFQRNFVWKPDAQSRFIDSLSKKLPIPSLLLGKDSKSEKHIVIDGLQRIKTIVKFFEEEDWKLTKIQGIDEKISGKKVSIIKDKSLNLYNRVKNSDIPVTFLVYDFSNKSLMNDLFNIFNRINTGGVKLNHQEIRNCIFSGNFNNLLRDVAKSDNWKNCMGKTSKVIRFESEEIILRVFAFNEELDDYDGNLARFLNNYMAKQKDISEDEIQEKRNIIFSSLSFINEKIDKPETVHTWGKTLKEGLLVGVSQNIDTLIHKSKEEAQALFEDFETDEEFSKEKLKQGLSKKAYVQSRLRKSIEIFGK